MSVLLDPGGGEDLVSTHTHTHTHTHGSPAVSTEGQEAASPQQEASLGKDLGF